MHLQTYLEVVAVYQVNAGVYNNYSRCRVGACSDFYNVLGAFTVVKRGA